VSDFWLQWEMVFGFTSILRVKKMHMMGRRNRCFEGTEDGQMTPPGYPNFDSYIKNLRVLVFQTDGQTDRQTDGEIHPLCVGWRNFFPLS
jgi:hypothetical protein